MLEILRYVSLNNFMPTYVAFFILAGTELFKSLSISSLENSKNLLCNANFSASLPGKLFQLGNTFHIRLFGI